MTKPEMLVPVLRGPLADWLPLFPDAPFGAAFVLAAPLCVMKTSLEVDAFGGNTRITPEAAEDDAEAEPRGTGNALVKPGEAWAANGDGSLVAVWPGVREAVQAKSMEPKHTAVKRSERGMDFSPESRSELQNHRTIHAQLYECKNICIKISNDRVPASFLNYLRKGAASRRRGILLSIFARSTWRLFWSKILCGWWFRSSLRG